MLAATQAGSRGPLVASILCGARSNAQRLLQGKNDPILLPILVHVWRERDTCTTMYHLADFISELQSLDKICNLSFFSHLVLFLSLQPPSPPRAAICICNLWDLQTCPVPSPSAPLSAACCNLYLQSGICRLPPLALRCGDRDHF